jgi:hypothetical protein
MSLYIYGSKVWVALQHHIFNFVGVIFIQLFHFFLEMLMGPPWKYKTRKGKNIILNYYIYSAKLEIIDPTVQKTEHKLNIMQRAHPGELFQKGFF